MTYPEKIQMLRVKFDIDSRKLSILLGVNRVRLNQIETGEKKMSKTEMLKIDRAIKVRKTVEKPKETEELIEEQKLVVTSLGSKLLNKVTQKEIEDLTIEAMYYGMLLANNLQDEEILIRVRNRRK
jgi:DNA-binding transcriptional regulator YdaS (Cro superfamily)